jgi:hypothetical protein
VTVLRTAIRETGAAGVLKVSAVTACQRVTYDARFPPRMARWIREYFAAGETPETISAEMGVPAGEVRRICGVPALLPGEN